MISCGRAMTVEGFETTRDPVEGGTGALRESERWFLEEGIAMIEEGRHEEADRLLTSALFSRARDSDLWMAAGLARLGRGARRSAACAFRMCAWLSGDPVACELAALLR